MRQALPQLKLKVAFAFSLLLAAITIFPHQSLADPARRALAVRPFHCYCGCESAGKSCATKLCELPKYENRDWATSCRKHALENPRASESTTGVDPAPAHSSQASHAVFSAHAFSPRVPKS
jgi:hypothetical protein